jgi:hypothetical protein
MQPVMALAGQAMTREPCALGAWGVVDRGRCRVPTRQPGIRARSVAAVHLHALASLIAQAGQLLPQAVHDARDQELTWAQIGELLGATAAAAAHRYRNKP